ncbi:hypothetical protein [Pedosphaera parvula]|uniref:Uncharacterized protein n=1 Tax=Pedosphaera parvula (strain Ellin514) TaxID=320771 RepID=B9XEF6_PEDPL|nr:hypothetical protein [Pedosphaera parvula]EEF61670.1 hypothetical protein Cflav_PD4710 [Pedosphaera parvula Ellin514]
MGNFYTNYTLKGPSQQEVADFLKGRRAIVTPNEEDCVVVFDEQSDEQDQEQITELGTKLSAEFRCPVLAVLNHDDDIFWYQLYEKGKVTDEYDSSPSYFDSDAESITPPTGGDAQRLCAAFGGGDEEEVESILRKEAGEGYTFAVERHADLVGVLGIPDFGVGFSYEAFEAGECPEGINPKELIRTK